MMSRYIRSLVPGATYFFTIALADRRSGLLIERIAELRSAWTSVRALHPFETVAVCILPDHLHAVWTLPADDANYPLRWQQIKRRFSTAVPCDIAACSASKQGKREAGIWQRRYWEHQIRDEADLGRHVDYIHYNPVKHGLVRCVSDWPYSSLHRWAREQRLPAGWEDARSSDGAFGER